MKKVIFICLLCPGLVMAQKEIKPSVSKAESALQKGAFDEAKAIIDATVASQEYMVDKKSGGPSKNAAKAWYLRGVIYAGIDTTKQEKFKSLAADPFTIAKESFEKCNCPYASYNINEGMTKDEVKKYFGEPDKMPSPDQWVYSDNVVKFKNDAVVSVSIKDNTKPVESKNEKYVSKLNQGLPLPLPTVLVAKIFAQKFLERGYEAYKKQDYKSAFIDVEKVVFFVPNDTTQLMNAGVYFAPVAEQDDKAIVYINQFIAGGGKNLDAIQQLYNIYFKKKDMDSALKLAKKLLEKYPNKVEYLNQEYNIYVQTNNLKEAKAVMEKRAKVEPDDTESRFFLALISKKMEDLPEAKRWLLEVIKLNPDHYDANEELAAMLNQEARKINDLRNNTKDIKKRQELFNERIAKFREALPYAEKCVEIKPNEENALYGLFSLYENLSTFDDTYTKKSADLKARMKALGLQVD